MLTLFNLFLFSAVVSASTDDVRNFRLSFAGSAGAYYVAFDASHKSEEAEVRWSVGAQQHSSKNCTRLFYDVFAGHTYHCSVVWPAGRLVRYSAGLADRKAWGPVFSVESSVEDPQEYSVWVCGDVGMTHATDTIAAWGKSYANVAFALHPGDISYANDVPYKFETRFSQWFHAMSPGIASVPYMVAPGNHEAWSRNPLQSGLNFTAYRHMFRMPHYEVSQNMWYSFKAGPVQFIAFSSENGFPGHPHDLVVYPQLQYLEAELAAVNRTETPWIVVYGHRPYYISYGQSKVQKAEQAVFEPLFQRYGVQLGIFGHVHHYERMAPTFNGTETPGAMVTIVAGGGGNIEGVSRYERRHPVSYFKRGYDQGTSYGILGVKRNALTWSLFDSKSMLLKDQLVISKPK